MTEKTKSPHITCIEIEQPPKLYRVGPDWDVLSKLDLAADDIVPRTVVVDAPLLNAWLERVSTQKYPSLPTRLDNYKIDLPGLIPIEQELVEFQVHNTNVSIAKIHIEEALEGLVEIYESKVMGPLRALRLFHHNLLLTPATGSEMISKLQPYLEEGKEAYQKFMERLRSIKHPNVKLNQTEE